MREHAANLEFEDAAALRDQIHLLQEPDLGMSDRDALTERIKMAEAWKKGHKYKGKPRRDQRRKRKRIGV